MITILFIFIFSSFSFANPQDITLALFQKHRLSVPPGASISASHKNSIILSVEDNQLSMLAKKVGTTHILINNKKLTVHVVSPETAKHFSSLQKIIEPSLGLTLEINQGIPVVKGQLYSLADFKKLLQFRKTHGMNFLLQAKLPAYLQTELQQTLNETLTRNTLSPQKIIFDPNPHIYVSPQTPSLKKLEEVALTLGIETLVTKESLEVHPTVKVDVFIVEIKKSHARNLGVQWPATLSADLLPGSGPQYGKSEFAAHALEGQGFGKIIAQPTLLARSGEEARFHAGGEFPIKILKFRTQEVFWKSYGLTLVIRPEVDRSGRLKIKLDTEITSIDKGTSSDDIPGVKTNKVSSQFDLLKPQTIAISGLVSAEEFKSSSGLPALQKIPVLGKLFSSEDFLSQKTELVIFVRPQVLKETL